jgi:hypothetical protein
LRQASRRSYVLQGKYGGFYSDPTPKAISGGVKIALEGTHIQTTKTKMKNPKYKALVMVDEVTNSVVVMFNGFEDYEDAWSFSQHITEELELDKIPVAKPLTVH